MKYYPLRICLGWEPVELLFKTESERREFSEQKWNLPQNMLPPVNMETHYYGILAEKRNGKFIDAESGVEI